MTTQASRSDIRAAITAAAQERILVLDGAMGTMIQQLRLDAVAISLGTSEGAMK